MSERISTKSSLNSRAIFYELPTPDSLYFLLPKWKWVIRSFAEAFTYSSLTHTIDEHHNKTRTFFSGPHTRMYCRTESPFPHRLHIARFRTTVTSPPVGVPLWRYQRRRFIKRATKSSLFQGNCKRITARVRFSVPVIREIWEKYVTAYAKGTWLIAGARSFGHGLLQWLETFVTTTGVGRHSLTAINWRANILSCASSRNCTNENRRTALKLFLAKQISVPNCSILRRVPQLRTNLLLETGADEMEGKAIKNTGAWGARLFCLCFCLSWRSRSLSPVQINRFRTSSSHSASDSLFQLL
jgi:hypothetical protein